MGGMQRTIDEMDTVCFVLRCVYSAANTSMSHYSRNELLDKLFASSTPFCGLGFCAVISAFTRRTHWVGSFNCPDERSEDNCVVLCRFRALATVHTSRG